MKVDLALLERIQENILRGATGCPEHMAKKLGISKRQLHYYIKYLKTKFDSPIAYSRPRETFYYTGDWEFYVGNLTRIKSELIKGVLDSISKNIKTAILCVILSGYFSILCAEGIWTFC